MNKRKILFCGDGVTKTGFSTVLHNIIGNLPADKYIPYQIAINYYGDPHNFPWKMYPASLKGDLWGFNRIEEFSELDLSGIFILNDLNVVPRYLEKIKKYYTKIPPIIIYSPIDSMYLDQFWFENFDIVSGLVVYTKFGYDEIKRTIPEIEPIIIPHGVNNSIFYKINKSKEEIRREILPDKDDLINSFIFLNANRNQPRKRIDLTIEGFAKFVSGKPENVKLYLHMGLKDAGWDILKLAYRYGLDDRLIITGTQTIIPQVPESRLNVIYNACDIGVGTSIGEGWGLVHHEHACTGAPQIVPNHSALHELYEDCGILLPVKYYQTNQDTLTVSSIVDSDDVAEAMEKVYSDRELFDSLSKKSIEKFTSLDYSWKYIVQTKWEPLFDKIFVPENVITNKSLIPIPEIKEKQDG